ncbi:MAG: DEAD/DEAH box helicase family protein, partial [Vicinamibacterales bacterium]|nr:DEAD/DEAH box helicase family protein [Vicinamibacterales bacterium]
MTHAPCCTAVDLVGAEPACAGRALTLVTPFDEVTPSPAGDAPMPASPAAALRRLARLLALAPPWPAPLAARDARMDLHPHQMSAALAFAAGRARRILVADAVGTGKTVQAGLAIAQTLADTACARVLVATPSSLKPQWRQELRDRFTIEARVVEAAVAVPLAGAADSPWAARGVVIASFDYLKRADVLGGLDAAWWHLLVIDEAHHAAGPSDRGHALRALAARALRVLMLTATPHDGDQARFDALCGTGAHAPPDPLLRLARDPRGAPCTRRRTHVRHAGRSPEEERASQLLERYLDAMARRVGDPEPGALGLLSAVLRKRAASSPAALARSARRRR